MRALPSQFEAILSRPIGKNRDRRVKCRRVSVAPPRYEVLALYAFVKLAGVATGVVSQAHCDVPIILVVTNNPSNVGRLENGRFELTSPALGVFRIPIIPFVTHGVVAMKKRFEIKLASGWTLTKVLEDGDESATEILREPGNLSKHDGQAPLYGREFDVYLPAQRVVGFETNLAGDTE